MDNSKTLLYSGFVWIFSGLALTLYALLGLSDTGIPGIEQLVSLIQSTQGIYVFLAVFAAIFIEGLYVIGSVFPGSSIVLLSAIVAQTGGPTLFATVLITILVGWNLAGLINVITAKLLKRNFLQHIPPTKSEAEHLELTWFPAFRANTEVAEIIEGKRIREVLWSSLKIKSITSIGLGVYALIVPFFIDINNLTNTEGFVGLFIIALISFGIGMQKILEHKKQNPPT